MEDLLVGSGTGGTPARLRDLATLSRGYESPPRYLNYLVSKDRDGRWQRNRAITLAVSMRSGGQIGEFGEAVDKTLERLRPKLPPDLIVARTSDQPRQVAENVVALHGQPLRGDRPRRRRLAGRLLELALGAPDRDVHPDHASP